MDRDRTVNITDMPIMATRQSALERRLHDGYLRIDQAIANGEDVASWEDFWFSLLAEYEALSDELNTAA